MKTFFFLIFSLLLTTGIFATETKPTAVGLDVRSSMELKMNPAPGAVFVPVGDVKSMVEKKIPNKETPILVFCESGRRADSAVKVLKSMGYKDVKNIGSWRDWNKLKKPQEKSPKK